jgi:autotransporter-associated beta strand protein
LAGANGMTKAGTGTVTLSGTNSYTGATIVNQGTLELAFSGDNNAGVGTIAVGSDITVNAGGTLLGSAVNALGSATGHTVDGTTDQLTINEGGQLRVGAGTVLSMPYALNVVGGTISSVDGGHPSFGTIFYGSTEGTFTSSSGGTAATISAQNFNLQGASFNVVQGGGPVDLSVTGNLIGNALTKNGNGVMVLSGNNTYSGATTVTGGVLNLNSSAGSSLESTASVAVSTGATLLISQSGQVNNSAAVTLSGGTITRGAGVSEVFGSLNITGSGILDFGTGAVGNLTFGTYQNNQQTESALLTLNNFMPGNSFTFSSTSFSTNSVGSYFTFGTGYAGSSIIDNGGSSFTITAIPEPSTVLAALGLAGLMLWPARRRFTRQFEGSRNS